MKLHKGDWIWLAVGAAAILFIQQIGKRAALSACVASGLCRYNLPAGLRGANAPRYRHGLRGIGVRDNSTFTARF